MVRLNTLCSCCPPPPLPPRDIAELTQHVNRLENQQNRLSEENEALRDQLGLGMEDSVDLSELRAKRNAETERLRTMNRMLENEVGGALAGVTVSKSRSVAPAGLLTIFSKLRTSMK